MKSRTRGESECECFRPDIPRIIHTPLQYNAVVMVTHHHYHRLEQQQQQQDGGGGGGGSAVCASTARTDARSKRRVALRAR